MTCDRCCCISQLIVFVDAAQLRASHLQVISDARLGFLNNIIAQHLPWLQGYMFTGIYTDVSPNWYKNVGQKLLLTFEIQVAVVLLKTGYVYLKDRYAQRTAEKAKTQPDMNECAMLLQHHLSHRYWHVDALHFVSNVLVTYRGRPCYLQHCLWRTHVCVKICARRQIYHECVCVCDPSCACTGRWAGHISNLRLDMARCSTLQPWLSSLVQSCQYSCQSLLPLPPWRTICSLGSC